MLLSVTGLEGSPFLPLVAAFAVSLLTSMGGVSGAFLLLPFQVSVLGCSAPSVSATNQLFNVLAAPGGVWRYYREGRLLPPLARTTTWACLPGVALGALIRLRWLSDPTAFRVFAALVLLYLALRLTRDLFHSTTSPASFRSGASTSAQKNAKSPPGDAKPILLPSSLPDTRGPFPARDRMVRFLFQGQEYAYNTHQVFWLTAVIGLVGGVYGIGGGAILAPFLVSLYGLPIYVTAGATLLCTLVTSVGGVLTYLALAPFFPGLAVTPDWTLGLLLGVGGMAGMNMGARLQKYIPARPIKILLTVIVTATAALWLFPTLASLF